MNSYKAIVRDILPHGFIESRRRAMNLKRLGLSRRHLSWRQIESAVQSCRFALWPEALRRAPFDWVLVDVGANDGQYLSSVLKLVSPQMVIAFEPLPCCHASLETVLAAAQESRLVKAAAGEESGKAEISITGDSKMSSVLLPDPRLASAYKSGALAVQQTIPVPVVRVDDVVPAGCRVGIFKIDVQGYEISVLRGAELTLQRTSAIQIEVNYVPHYQGACGFNDIHEFLTRLGFQLHAVSDPYFGNGRPLWADAIYARSEVLV